MRLASVVTATLLVAAGCAHGPDGFDHRPQHLSRLIEAPARTPDELLQRGWARLITGCDWTGATADLVRAAKGSGEDRRRERQLAYLGAALSRLARAEFKDAMEGFAAAVESDPATPAALVAAQQLSETAHQVRSGHARLAGRIERVLVLRPPPETARALRIVLRDAALRAGNRQRASRIERDMGVVPVWRTTHPWGRHPLVGFERSFAPERAPVEPGALPDHAVLRPAWPVEGHVALESELDDGVLYAGTFFRLDQPADLELRISGQDTWAVFVDDRRLGVHTAHREHMAGVARTAFRAGAGWHRLLLKIAIRQGAARLAVELTAADGRPAGVKWWSWPDPSPAYQQYEARPRPATGPRARDMLSERADRYPNDAVAPLLAGLLDWEAGDLARARARLDQAARRAPTFALPDYLTALLMLEDPDIPPGIDGLQSRERLELALRKCPGFLLARFRLALLDSEQGHQERALSKLAGLAEQRPESFLWPLYRGRIQEHLGWEPEAGRSFRRALARMPDSVDVLRRLFELSARHNAISTRAQLADRLEELGYFEEGQVALWTDRGQESRARELLDRIISRHPGRLAARLNLVDLLVRKGELEHADRRLGACEAIAQHRIEVMSRRADLLDRRGRTDQARNIREEISRRHTWHLPSRAALAATRDTGVIRLAGGRRLDALKIIAEHKSSGRTSKGNAALLLDQASVEVGPDGSSLERIHMVVKIISPEGLEHWGEIDTIPQGAHVEHLRTISADGRIHDAEVIPGKDSVTLPALQVGDFVEIAYMHGMRGSPPVSRSYIRGFLFGVVGTPILHSLFSVAVPRGTELIVERHNSAPSPVERRQDGFDVYTFERHDTPALAQEPHAPPIHEFAPMVRVGFGISWRDVRDVLRTELIEAGRLTPGLRRYAVSAAGRTGDPASRLRRLFRKVCDDVHQAGGTDDFEQPASYILARREGNRLVLLFALLRALGYQPRVLLSRTVAHAQLDYRLPATDSFSHGLIAVDPPGSQTIWLDPSERFNPFGVLYPFLAGMPAMDVTATDPDTVFTRLPDTIGAGQQKRIDLELELFTDGTLAGRGRESLSTSQAASYRAALLSMSPGRRRQALEAGLGGYFSGSLLTEFDIQALDDPSRPLQISYTFRAPAWARRRPDALVLQGGFYPYQLGSNLVAGATRKTPLLLTDQTRTHTRVTIELPQGARAELPEPVRLTAPLSEFEMEFSQEGRRLTIEKRLTVDPGRVSPEDYPAFRDFCRKVDARDTEGIVVRLGGAPGSESSVPVRYDTDSPSGVGVSPHRLRRSSSMASNGSARTISSPP